MKYDVKVSVIVPVYNVKDFLESCVYSLIKQTLFDIEIILVDDGSTDGSGNLCDLLCEKDSRIFVIHKTNNGLSSARNTGIVAANADYIMFVDSDDYIDQYACERLFLCAEKHNADIVNANEIIFVGSVFKQGLKKITIPEKEYSGIDYMAENMKHKCMQFCAPFSIYRKELITKNRLFFKENILHEDELWTPQTYLYAHSVVYMDYHFYYHRSRSDSITHQKNKAKNSADLMSICYELFGIYCYIDERYKHIFLDYICMLYMNAVYIVEDKHADTGFAKKVAISMRSKVKVLIYSISPSMYLFINRCIKGIKHNV